MQPAEHRTRHDQPAEGGSDAFAEQRNPLADPQVLQRSRSSGPLAGHITIYVTA